MKNGTMYAKRVKRVFARLKPAARQVASAEPVEPVEEMLRALLSYETTLEKADRALRALRARMVDLNEERTAQILRKWAAMPEAAG